MAKTKKPTTRPGVISQTTFDRICARISGGESLRTILASDGMPCLATFFNHLRHDGNQAHVDQYARAKEESADHYAELIVEAALADPERDEMSGRVDSGEVQHRRLRVDALKWIACKLKPKVYGDRQALEHSGPSGSPIQVITGVPT